MPIFLLIILIFTIWLTYELKKTSKSNTTTSEDFWKRESEAAYVPAKSTDDVKFFTIEADVLPVIGYNDDPDLKEYTAELKTLCGRQLADLSAYTNTDLKLKYGTRNFQPLCDADAYCTQVVTLVSKIIPLLVDADRCEDAKKLLDYAESVGMSSRNITLSRGRYYAKTGDIEALDELISSVKAGSSDPSSKLVRELTSLLEVSVDPVEELPLTDTDII